MKQELEDKLFNDFPLLYNRTAEPRPSLAAFGFECHDGWYGLIRELSEKLYPFIEEAIKEYPESLFCASQVKQKYGTLRFYMLSSTGAMDALIEEYEERSHATCEICGEEGSKSKDKFWITTRCEEHKECLKRTQTN